MSSIVLSGDTSGTVTVAVPAVAGTNTATFPAATGTVMVSGNMPAFSAYSNANQTVTTATYTALQVNEEVFDTNSNYDISTYRFQPTVAGYYQINGAIQFNATTNATRLISTIYKNGVLDTYGTDISPYLTTTIRGVVSGLFYMNGTTDYINLYCYAVGTGTLTITSGSTKLSGYLARAA